MTDGRDASPGRSVSVSFRSAALVAFGGICGWACAREILRRRVDDGPLSARQREILAMVGRGMSSKQIARQTGIGEQTVNTHIRRARAALGAPTRAAAVAIASGGQAGTPARPRRSAMRPSAVTISPTSSSNGT